MLAQQEIWLTKKRDLYVKNSWEEKHIGKIKYKALPAEKNIDLFFSSEKKTQARKASPATRSPVRGTVIFFAIPRKSLTLYMYISFSFAYVKTNCKNEVLQSFQQCGRCSYLGVHQAQRLVIPKRECTSTVWSGVRRYDFPAHISSA